MKCMGDINDLKLAGIAGKDVQQDSVIFKSRIANGKLTNQNSPEERPNSVAG